MRILLVHSNKIMSYAVKDFISKSDRKLHIDILCPSSQNQPEEPLNHYDVIVTDYSTLPKIPKECFNHSKVLIMDSGLAKETIVSLFLTEKVMGLIPADSDIEVLLKAIKVVHKGEVWIDNSTVKSLLDSNITRKVKESARLTEREHSITRLVREGYRNKEIAELLSISDQTVKSHLNRIFRKMDVTARTELIAKLASHV